MQKTVAHTLTDIFLYHDSLHVWYLLQGIIAAILSYCYSWQGLLHCEISWWLWYRPAPPDQDLQSYISFPASISKPYGTFRVSSGPTPRPTLSHRHHHCTSNIIITIIIELVLLRHLDDASTSVELLTECASWFWVGRQSRWFSMGRSSRTPQMICHHHHHHHLTAISLIFYGTLSWDPEPQSDSSLLQQQATTLSSKIPASKGDCVIFHPCSM